ncbi:stalk domain-containing protein [Paenibacillus sonchi]|uniref:stalk domain-containing protein n=1 Tax=Paenibacillus sonchi TaxID=373687 RepID=UPI001E2C551D|nr:stalk domain-containing protein [Paenibacillus sonchi]MCE3200207.1 copper amine oxidase [Paenibacillus sonchi]
MKKWTLFCITLLGVSLVSSTAASADTDTTSASSIKSFGTDWLTKTDGSFWIWDYNQSVPTQIPGLTGASASYNGGLAVMEDHTIKQWSNDYYTPVITVKPVSGLSSIQDVLDWNGTLVADATGAVYTKVRADDSQPQSEVTYTPVAGIDNVADIEIYTEEYSDSMRYRHLFLKKDGTVWRDNGELQEFEPIQNLHDIVQIAENYALQKDGTVWTWPAAFAEKNPPASASAASKFTALTNIQTLKHEQKSTLAIDKQSRLWFWGGTVTGYADGWTYADHPDPVLITSIRNVKDAFVVEHSLIVQTLDNKVYSTSVARDAMPANPSFVLLASDISNIKNGGRHMIMQKKDGSLWGWGVNKNSELGYGDYEFMHDTPVPVQKPIAVSLNGENVPLTAGVITRNGQNFVPLRSLFDKLGAEIGFDGTSKLATVTRTNPSLPALKISVNAKNGQTTLNGQAMTLENKPFTVNGTLYLPLRFISEKLGATVEWLPKEERIAITLK